MIRSAMLLAAFLSIGLSGPATAELYHLYYFGGERLVILGFDVKSDGQALEEAWKRELDTRFAELDENDDGQLTGRERDGLPNVRLTRLINGTSQLGSHGYPRPIDRKEFERFLAGLGFKPFQFILQPRSTRGLTTLSFYGGNRNNRQSGQILFSGLDKDNDSRVTREETEDAFQSLSRMDFDQDETISAAELVPANTSLFFSPPVYSDPSSNNVSPFLAQTKSTSPRDIAGRMLKRFDQEPKDGNLSQSELGIPEENFKKRDLDNNGLWDFEEMQQSINAPALDATIRLELSSDGKKPPKISFEHSQVLSSDVKQAIGSLNFGAVQMEVSGGQGQPQNAKQILMQQFQNGDADNNGYIDESEARRLGAIQTVFGELDKDLDGKLFPEEMLGQVLPIAHLMSRQIQIRVDDRGRDLFRILDTDSDNRLSRRELLAMPKRAALWDGDNHGAITMDNVPQQYRFVAERGDQGLANRLSGVRVFNVSGQMPSPGIAKASGPMWFQKMDRNGDGDLSEREFLGPHQLFQNLDTNQDQLVSADEAASWKSQKSTAQVTSADSSEE